MSLSTSHPSVPAGRPKKQSNNDLLPRLKRRKSGNHFLYYFLHADGYQEPLGKDKAVAFEIWKALYSPDAKSSPTSFKKVSEDFEQSDHFKSLAVSTQRDYGNALKRLRLAFKDTPLELIRPKAIRSMKKAMVATKTQFNNFKSIISTIYWWAIDEEEIVECDNPCLQVSDYKTKPKKVKVTAPMYYAVYDEGPTALKDWMDLALIVGQRVSGVFGLKWADIDAGKLSAFHSKVGSVVDLSIEEDLKSVLDRIRTRPGKISSVYILADENGQPVTYWKLRTMFDNAQEKAKAKWEAEEREWVTWQRKDLRTKNATDADTLQQAQERLAHSDSRTTKSHYRLGLKAKPNKLPQR